MKALLLCSTFYVNLLWSSVFMKQQSNGCFKCLTSWSYFFRTDLSHVSREGVNDGTFFSGRFSLLLQDWFFFSFFFLQTEANILSLVSDANATARPIFLKCLFEKKKKNKRGDKNLKAISRVPQCKLINDIWCQTPLFHFVTWRNYRAYNYVIKEKRKAHLLCKIFSTLVTTALKRKQIIAF